MSDIENEFDPERSWNSITKGIDTARIRKWDDFYNNN